MLYVVSIVAAGAVLAAMASYAHTRRFGTRRNIRVIYLLMGIVFVVESALNLALPAWHIDDWCLRPMLLLLCIAPVVGSMLTWLRINNRGVNWAQIIALRERKALAED